MSTEISQQKSYPDPRMDPWDYQAALGGYKDGEEFKQAYMQQAKKAVVAGTAAGTGVFAAGFGLSAGAIVGGAELPAVLVGVVGRFAKNIGIKAWEMAKSAWVSVMGTAATPQGQEVVKNTVECVESLVNGTPPPTTPKANECYSVSKAKEAIDYLKNK